MAAAIVAPRRRRTYHTVDHPSLSTCLRGSRVMTRVQAVSGKLEPANSSRTDVAVHLLRVFQSVVGDERNDNW